MGKNYKHFLEQNYAIKYFFIADNFLNLTILLLKLYYQEKFITKRFF